MRGVAYDQVVVRNPVQSGLQQQHQQQQQQPEQAFHDTNLGIQPKAVQNHGPSLTRRSLRRHEVRQQSGQNNSNQGSYHDGALQQRLRTAPNVQRLFETGVREADPPKNWTEYPNEQLGGPDKELIRKADSAEVEVSLKPRSGKQLAKYTLTVDIARGTQSAELKDDSGLKVDDNLMLSAGTDREEVVQIIGFGSVHFGRPTQHMHHAGSTVIRCDPYGRVGSQRISSDAGEDDDLDGLEPHESWSSNKREHQRERHRRRQRGKRHPRGSAPEPKNITQTVRRPEKFECPPVSGYEGLEDWEDKVAREFRVVTCGGDHTEEYIREAIEAARKNRHEEDSPEWIVTFESFRNSDNYFEPYATALEKLAVALEDRLKGDLECKWKSLKKQRRPEKRSTPDGRQLVVFVLQPLRFAQTGTPEALLSSLALRDKCKAHSLTTDSPKNSLRQWDDIMLLASPHLVSQSDKLKYLLECVQTCNDSEFKTQVAFFYQIPQAERTAKQLRKSVDIVLERHREIGQRVQQEKAIKSKKDSSSSSRRGTPGQEQPTPKAAATSAKLKEQLTSKDRKIA